MFMSNGILIHHVFLKIHIKFPDIHVKTFSLTNASISSRLFHIWNKKIMSNTRKPGAGAEHFKKEEGA